MPPCSSLCEYIVHKCRNTDYTEIRNTAYTNPYNAITPGNTHEWQICKVCKAKGIRFNLPCIWCDISAEHIYGREYHPYAHSIMPDVANSECVRRYQKTHTGISDIDAFRILLHTHNAL